MHRWPTLSAYLPLAALAAATAEALDWWDDWVGFWGDVVDPIARADWKNAQRELDADMIEPRSHGGFAAGVGGDE